MHESRHGADTVAAEAATDPVCGMRVDPATSRHRVEHAGGCSISAAPAAGTKFVADPARYLAPGEPPAGPGRRDLHLPDAPGDPPGRARAAARSAAWRWSRCKPAAEAGPNPELRDMSAALLDRAAR